MAKTTFPDPIIKVTPAIQMQLFKQLRESGSFFKALFIKKTNNELRIMICRFGVKKHVNGKGLKYDPLERGYLPVWDSEKLDYRMLNLNTLIAIQFQEKTYKF
ncbi:MAG: hypothetical protein ACXAAH_09525 [Promethearchaeota archaeon]|jgi:hypothetical protein